jgi:hypothetical protein
MSLRWLFRGGDRRRSVKETHGSCSRRSIAPRIRLWACRGSIRFVGRSSAVTSLAPPARPDLTPKEEVEPRERRLAVDEGEATDRGEVKKAMARRS